MNTLIKANFGEPVRIDLDSDFMAEEATVLEISESQTQAELSVVLLFQDYPAIHKSVVLYSGEEYTGLGDWTYLQLISRIKLYYESGLGFPQVGVELEELPPPEPETSEAPAEEVAPEPETSEAPTEEVAPEAETSEPAPEEPAPTEEVVAPTTKRSKR